MAAPAYTTDLTTIATGDLNVDAGSWGESTDAGYDTGGAMVDDQNLYYNNTECVSAQLTKDANGTGAAGPATILYVHTGSFTIPTDGAILIHHLWAAPPALNTLGDATSAGINILLGNSLGDFEGWAASGSDFPPAPRGGWANYALNPAIGSPDHTVGTPTGTYTTAGMAVSALQQARGNPNAVNAIRYGRCEARFTDGDIGNGYCTFAGYAAVDDSTTNRWNLIEPIGGGYRIQGLMSIGLTGTSADFRDANTALSIRDTINVTAAFNKIEIHNSGTNVEWNAISVTALGTISKCAFEMVDNATVALTDCTFTDMDTFLFQSNGAAVGSVFRRCGQITPQGADLTGATVEGYEGTADTSAVIYNEVADPDGEFDNMSFTKGTAATHAIEFGLSSPTTINLRGIDFSGYNATVDTNDTALNFLRTTGTVTVNLIGCTGTIQYKKPAGLTVDLVVDPVTVKVKCIDSEDSSDLNGVQVYMTVADATNYPFEGSVTIAVVTTTATVTHTAHGLATGMKVQIEGANQTGYNGIKTITVTDANTYTYTVVNDGAATGTITSTFVILSGVTAGLGELSVSYTFASNQPVIGWVRLSSTAPFYKTASLAGNTIGNTTGLTATVSMVKDQG